VRLALALVAGYFKSRARAYYRHPLRIR
jgi:hypothetical protein